MWGGSLQKCCLVSSPYLVKKETRSVAENESEEEGVGRGKVGVV